MNKLESTFSMILYSCLPHIDRNVKAVKDLMLSGKIPRFNPFNVFHVLNVGNTAHKCAHNVMRD